MALSEKFNLSYLDPGSLEVRAMKSQVGVSTAGCGGGSFNFMFLWHAEYF